MVASVRGWLLLALGEGALVLDLFLAALGVLDVLVPVGRTRRLEPVDRALAALAPAVRAAVVGELLAVEGELPLADADRRPRAQRAVGRLGRGAAAHGPHGTQPVLVALVVVHGHVVRVRPGQLDVLVGARAE